MRDESTSKMGPSQISEVLHLGLRAGAPWRTDELEAFLNHTLASPLAFDLGGLPSDSGAQLRALCNAQGLLLKSLGDLLEHPSPPLKALELAKDFAKICSTSPHSEIPRPVATVLYYACIAVALLRADHRISNLPDAELRRGLAWVLAQSWVAGPIRALIGRAVSKLPGSAPEAI